MVLKNKKILSFEGGLPKICVPITGKTREEILNSCRQIAAVDPDLAEWRVDFYENALNTEKVMELAEEMNQVLKSVPMLFTFRTAGEGGEKAIEPGHYRDLNLAAARSGAAACIDVEVFMQGLDARELIRKIQECNIFVITSNHHFHETPSDTEMLQIFNKMAENGADIRKLAVMPRSKEDVIRLLGVTAQVSEDGKGPVITMSMGALGCISRISGEIFGSCMTYASLGAASAPGQLDVKDVRIVQNILHETISQHL